MRLKPEKSPLAFRTISEVAKELDLPPHVLRFWETKFSKIQPLKRSGNRRYYRPNDITIIKNIKKFLYDDGYTVKGVQKLLEDQKSNFNENSDLNSADSKIGDSKTANKNKNQLKTDLKNLVDDLDALIDKL